jgi:hypothetical protein
MTEQQRERAAPKKNITGTIPQDTAPVMENRARRAAAPCGFVVAGEDGRDGFCDAPAERRSSYCARHRALCQVAPASAGAASILAEFARAAERATPPGLVPPDRAALPDPEPVEVVERADALAGFVVERAAEES